MSVIVRTNIRDFTRQLSALKLDMQTKVVRRATSAAASVLRAAVRAKAAEPKAPNARRPRTGTLARAVYMVRNRRQSTRGAERFTVGVRSGRRAAKTGRDAFYWRFLEGGWIPRGPGQRIAGGKRRKALERARLTAARVQYPFIAPAFLQARGRALQVFQDRLDRELKKVAK